MPSMNRKSNGRRLADSDDEPMNGSDDDRDQQGDITDRILAKVDPEYLNTAIDLRQGDAALRKLIGALGSLRKEVKDVENTLSNVASEMAEMLSDELVDEEYNEDATLERLQAHSTMKELEKDFLATLDRAKEISIKSGTISDMRQRLTQGHQLTNIYQMYEKKVQEPLEKERTKTARQKYMKDCPSYEGYRQIVWENLTSNQAVPSIKRFLPRQDGDEESDDEEIEFGAQTSNFQCPITLGVLEDPYKSTVCPHAFSGAAIKEIIQQEKGSTRCPVAGCSKTITLATIEPDEQLARRVAAHVKRQKEGRTQASTQARTYTRMELSDEDGDDDDEDDAETQAARKIKKEVKKEKAAAAGQ
ncbi:hypothetical protein BMF94_3183 [Rhodotorula taiwanensis]|uniref:SP-RING-type domain-containing protein n=1 Tax=Rhodotorula taiwanensis TaxID=741276 RepID=A0A2S5BA56_9BASI|nr:hypothetical protein BMF94_3183 [Rhodotorula taiwanensis]